MQFACTLIQVEVPTETLPCSSVKESPWNFTIDSPWTRTDDPSASRLATNPGLVSTESPGKTAVEPDISVPLSHTPPSLCNMAEPVSAASSDSGNKRIITQEIKLREPDTLIPA